MFSNVAPDDHLAVALAMSAATFSEYVGLPPDPWQRKLLISDHKRILVNCARQSGKTSCLATLALHRALYTPDSMVLMASPSLRQSGEIFRRCLHVYRGLNRPVPADSETALTLSLENGSRIVSLPGAEATIRGYSAVDLLLLDEASRLPDELYFSLRPMLATRSAGRIIAASTPWALRGWWAESWHDTTEGWERYEVPATECPRISAEFLEQEMRTLGPLRYASEYLCQFVASEGAAFRADEVARAFKEYDVWQLDMTPVF